jgi:hypothetical protein
MKRLFLFCLLITLFNSSLVAQFNQWERAFAKKDSNTTKNAITLSYAIANYSPIAGSTSITTLGTITTGVWNAGAITSSGNIIAYNTNDLVKQIQFGYNSTYHWEMGRVDALSGSFVLAAKTDGYDTTPLIITPSGNATFAGTINSGKVTSTDTVVGVFYRWTNAAYGGAYIADDHPDTMTFAGANEVHTIGGVHASAPLGYKLTSGGVLKNITVQDSSMTVGMTGKYDVAWSISFGSVTGVAPNAKFNAYIYVNDTKSEKTGAMRVLSGTNDIGTFCGTAMTLSLNANDIVKLKLINVDDANGNQVVVLYAKFHLSRIE